MKNLILSVVLALVFGVTGSVFAQPVAIGATPQQVKDSLAVYKADFKEISEGTISPRITGINVPLVHYLNVDWSVGIEFRKPDSVTHVLYTAYKVGQEDYNALLGMIKANHGEPYSDHPTAAVGKVWTVDNKYIIALALEGNQINLQYRDIDFAKRK